MNRSQYISGLERMFINLMERIQIWNWKEMINKTHNWAYQP